MTRMTRSYRTGKRPWLSIAGRSTNIPSCHEPLRPRHGHSVIVREEATGGGGPRSAHHPSELAITVLTVEEQLSGWYTAVLKAKQPAQLARAYRELAATVRFVSRLQIVDYGEAAINRYEQLRTQKVKLRRMDLRIAACVLTQAGAILVTRNARDFNQVPGLQVEDWSKQE